MTEYDIPQALNLRVAEAAFDSDDHLVLTLAASPGPDFDAILKLDPSFTETTWFLAHSCVAPSPDGCEESPLLSGYERGLALGADDSIYFGAQSTSDGTFVVRTDSSGTEVWSKGWKNSSSIANATDFVAAGPNGSVYGWGNCQGQAPGNPPDNSDGNVLVRYEEDGTQAFVTQVPKLNNNSNTVGGLLVDDEGNVYTGFFDYGDLQDPAALIFMKLTSEGELVITERVTGLTFFDRPRFAPDQASIYLPQPKALSTTHSNVSLYNLGLDGSVRWYVSHHSRTETIDPVEGVTWTGYTDTLDDSLVTADSVYLAGGYTNEYANGSTPRPATRPAYVVRLSLDGEQIWFQEFQFADDDDVRAPSSALRLAVAPDGDPLVFVNSQRMNSPEIVQSASIYNPLHLLKLKKADGKLVPWH